MSASHTAREHTGSAPHWPQRALLATDGSAHSIRAAEALAEMVNGDSTVRLVTVAGLEYAPYDDKWGQLSDEPERQEQLKRASKTAFEEAEAHLKRTGCRIETSVKLGNAAEQIMFEIHKFRPDLVVVGRAGRRRFERLLLGSVSEHLIKHSPVPVLVVP
jgi:nucleotide-binding universal stress UspA family protein